MKQYFQNWRFFRLKSADNAIIEEEWDLGNEILSEGTKAQAPLWFDQIHNDLKFIPFLARSDYCCRGKFEIITKEVLEFPWTNSSINKRNSYDNDMIKIELNNSTKLVKKSITEKELESPTTLKSEISQLLKMLAERRLRENRKQSSFSSKSSKWRKRQASDLDLLEQASNRLEGIPQNIPKQMNNFIDVTMSNIQPNIQIDSLF